MSAGLDVAVRGTARAGGPGTWQRVRSGARSSTVWVIAALVVLLAAIVGFLSQTGTEETRPLHWESSAPAGGRAVIEVLRARGIEVSTTESYDEAAQRAADSDATLLVFDPDSALAAEHRQRLRSTAVGAGAPLVVVEPGTEVTDWSPGVQQAYQTAAGPGGSAPLAPDCTWETAQRAGTVTDALERYSALGTPGTEVTVCYHHPWDQAGYGAVTREELDGTTVTVLGSRAWLNNSHLADSGNAALALGALGERDSLVYYYADPNDEAFGAGPDDELLGPSFDLVPAWFWVALLWLIPLGIAAMLWRGRRFGPLAVERLPVVVPPVETVLGRAGILQRAGARDSALHTLRTAALLRLASRLSLPPHSRTPEICAAVAARTARDPAEVNRLLAGPAPSSDAELTAIATAIATLESEVSPL
ncbi:DUF4350 domain-containing protein [Brevibacterium sp. R8603A2]|uniref:DUF4350 domain-containing protein n=1 Tax=Brevibacterium sp. R8603A2 TaxID=2929779 RepID=UPI001FFA8503|nr:DUF4350 domain-containing protein [Brevibacterium sp. R8603A2]MCK1803900.1 DUF4350 domain-containing protein [Brevibacterium sp. R8603A2]